MSLAALRCDACGGALAVPVGASAPRCVFCGDTHLAPVEADPVDPPEGFLPFALDEAAARATFRAFVRRSPWTPGAVRAGDAPLVRALVPAWSWAGEVETHWTALVDGPDGPEPRAGSDRREVQGVLIPSSQALSARELDGVAPFHAAPLRPTAAADAPWEVGSLTRVRALEAGRRGMEAVVREALHAALAPSRLRVAAVVPAPRGVPLLLPVWIATFQHRGRAFRVVINGQSGRVVGAVPVSWRRVLVTVALAVGFAGLVALVGLIVLVGVLVSRPVGFLSNF